MDKEQNVTIFFKNGTTARFEQVTQFRLRGSVMEFNFLSTSDGVFKGARFNHEELAGYTMGANVKPYRREITIRTEGEA